jgi:hypothetical protein
MLVNDHFKRATIAITLWASWPIGTAITTVDIASAFNIIATADNLSFTLANPTDLLSGDSVTVVNDGTRGFAVMWMNIQPKRFGTFIWDGTEWNNDLNLYGGNIVAIGNDLSYTQDLVFDNFRINIWGSGLDVRVACVSWNETIKVTCEQEYPWGSFTVGGTQSWVSAIISTAYTLVWDWTLVDGEKFVITLRNETTKQLYKITAWLHNTVATWLWSGRVEKIGVTSSSIITASNGVKFVWSDLQRDTTITQLSVTWAIPNNAQNVHVTNGAATVTLTMPSHAVGKVVVISRGTNSTGIITLQWSSWQIESVSNVLWATTSLAAAWSYGQAAEFISDGTNWLRNMNG